VEIVCDMMLITLFLGGEQAIVMSLSVCLSTRIFLEHVQSSEIFFVHITCGHGLVLF